MARIPTTMPYSKYNADNHFKIKTLFKMGKTSIKI